MPESNTPINNLPEFAGSIEINPGDQFVVDQEAIENVTRRIIGDAGFRGGTISIAIVDDPTIHKLNRQYLQHDWPTDVLSFLLSSDTATGFLEGEIIVSHETANRSASEYGWSSCEELLLYVIHGTLHLGGMDDGNDQLRAEMQRAEDRYLATIGISRPGHVDSSAGSPSDLNDKTQP